VIEFEGYIDAAAKSLSSKGAKPMQTLVETRNAQAAAAGDPIRLPNIRDERILPGGEDPIRPPYPVVELAVPDFDLTDFSLAQVDAPLAAQVAVRVWHLDPSYGKLWRLLYRLGDCVLGSLSQPDAFGGHTTIQAVRGSFGLNPETNDRQEVVAAAVIVFTIDDVAMRP
jgi:hypothetical protein